MAFWSGRGLIVGIAGDGRNVTPRVFPQMFRYRIWIESA